MTCATVSPSPAATALAPVTLAELAEAAALQTRVDRKYLVPLADLPGLLDDLPAGTRVLEIDGRRSFGYESTYFDTPDLRCYLDAARRRPRRFKVRTRLYVDSGQCRLEVKRRDGRRRTVKTQRPHDADDRDRLGAAGAEFVASATGPLVGAGPVAGGGPPASDSAASRLVPALRTRYTRTTFLLPREPARLTVDVDVECALPGRSGAAWAGLAVVETKGGHAPTTADRVLWRHGFRPVRVSKYATGLALLRPDLPANVWHRSLATLRGAA